jgi:drug/metabolite transporter (DMT)-like permease
LFYLATFGSIIAFSAYSWLMRVSNPALISTYAYVNPVVAMILGWMFANETLSVRTLVAAAVVLAGVAMITTAPRKPA